MTHKRKVLLLALGEVVRGLDILLIRKHFLSTRSTLDALFVPSIQAENESCTERKEHNGTDNIGRGNLCRFSQEITHQHTSHTIEQADGVSLDFI
jgi:hypothetical protein